MAHVKGVIICANVLSLVVQDGVNIHLKFIEEEGQFGDKKVNKKAEKTWDLRWDPDSSEETRRTWTRRLVAACPRLLSQEIQSGMIKSK